MPLIRMINMKPNTDDIVQIAFTDIDRVHCYKIQTKTWIVSEQRYRGNSSTGRFKTSDELWDHIEKYIAKKESLGFRICPK